MRTLIRPAIMSLVVLTLLTGAIYPGVVTGISAVLFQSSGRGQPDHEGAIRLLGSELDRPGLQRTAVLLVPAVGHGPGALQRRRLQRARTYGPTNPAQIDAVKGRVDALKAADSSNTAPIPVDLVTGSGSGLDPDISPAAAEYQVARVARNRKLSEDIVRAQVARFTHGRQFGFLGEARVTVLPLNLALDSLTRAQ